MSHYLEFETEIKTLEQQLENFEWYYQITNYTELTETIK